MYLGVVPSAYKHVCCGKTSSKVFSKNFSRDKEPSFGYRVSSTQSELLNYLKEKAPAHREFFGNKILNNMKKSNSSSFIRDFYLSAAVAEARILKAADHVAKWFKGA